MALGALSEKPLKSCSTFALISVAVFAKGFWGLIRGQQLRTELRLVLKISAAAAKIWLFHL